MSSGAETTDLAALLEELKSRSGLSYGTLAKRLHMSSSTLHRYCKGEGLPPDFATVERLGRLCRATPEELVELHRRWIAADAARDRERRGVPAPPPQQQQPQQQQPQQQPPAEPSLPSHQQQLPQPQQQSQPQPAPGGGWWRRRGRGVAAVVGACAAVLSAVLVAVLLSGNEDGGTAADGGAPAGAASQASDAPLDVVVRPHTLDPCEMAFLVDQEPATVPPPPMDTNATGWVNALGAVAAGRQAVEVTVQGTGDQPVVLNALRVHVTEAGEPLPWNLYGGYSACGGGPVDTAGFDVDLDAGAPEAVAGAGQDAFPLWVDATEPMVLYVAAHTEDKDVSWYLELEWSSGDRHGALRVDDEGRPFRTSATGGRTPWTYLVGGTEWLDGETLNPVG